VVVLLVSLRIHIHLVHLLVSSMANCGSAVSNVPEVWCELHQTELSDTRVVSYIMRNTLRVQVLFVVLSVCIKLHSAVLTSQNDFSG